MLSCDKNEITGRRDRDIHWFSTSNCFYILKKKKKGATCSILNISLISPHSDYISHDPLCSAIPGRLQV